MFVQKFQSEFLYQSWLLCLSPTESQFESVLPPEISMETFAKDILGFSAAPQELPQEHGNDL